MVTRDQEVAQLDLETESVDGAQRNRYVINSALRTLDLLKAFAQKPNRFSLAELSQVTSIEKNQLYRL